MRAVKSDRECGQFGQELTVADSLRAKTRDTLSWPRLDPSRPPGRVVELRGVIFQSDSHSLIGAWLIRPIQMLDRRLAGLRQSAFGPSFAMHVGLHVVMAGGNEFVVEQLLETPWNAFVSGVAWTPIEVFRKRIRGGWDVTVPATAFRKIDDRVVKEAIEFLNCLRARPYCSEDCPTFVERAFGRRRMFADSPTARWLGLGVRMGDPALPLLRPECRLDRRTERLLRASLLRTLPDPITSWNSPNARFLLHRMLFLGGFLLSGMLFGFLRTKNASRRQSSDRSRCVLSFVPQGHNDSSPVRSAG